MGGKQCRGAARWNGTSWDSLGLGFDYYINPPGFVGSIFKILRYKNKIYYFGSFGQAGKYHTPGMAIWNGTDWDSTGYFPNGYVYDADIYNDTLYICGGFSKIGSLNTNLAAKFDGTNWYPLSYPYPADGNMIGIRAFKNKVYGIGQWYGHGFGLTAEYTPALGWKPSFGIQGDVNKTLFGLERIDSLLFFYGRFSGISTIFSPDIAAWSGTHLYGFGAGIDYSSNFSTIERIKKSGDTVWVVGTFDNAGGMYFSGNQISIASFDLTKWCVYGDFFDNSVHDIAIYRGERVLGGDFWKANSDSVKKVAKWSGGSYTYSCTNYSMTSLAIGIKELNLDKSIRIYPNPVSNKLHIESEQYFESGTEIEITNTLGQTVLKLNYTNEIDVSSLSQGYYTLQIISPDKRQFHSKFLKE